MTVVSSKEFIGNDDKYFDMAVSNDVFVRKGNYMFHILCSPIDEHSSDDDFRNAISNAKPKRLSDRFRGVLSKESAESFIEHTKAMREEWNSI